MDPVAVSDSMLSFLYFKGCKDLKGRGRKKKEKMPDMCEAFAGKHFEVTFDSQGELLKNKK